MRILLPTMLLYSLGLLAAIVIASPYWLLRMVRSGRYRDGLAQRLGAVPSGLRELAGRRRIVWVHAVSVGEVIAATRLVALLDRMRPDVAVVISTTTRTGQQMARKRFENAETLGTRVFFYPLDFAWIVRRYLRVLRPCALVLMESELWPRMIWEADRAGIPVIVANGRISDRSLPRYRALRALWRPFLRRLTLVLAQSEQDEQRFRSIGVPDAKLRTAGNLKYDVRIAEEAAVTRELRDRLPENARVIVAGSTLAGEESYLLSAFHQLRAQFPNLILILAPRHPERFGQVADLIQEKGFLCSHASEWMQHPAPLPEGCVFLLDSMGDLASVYALASVAFVGGSLVPSGGHNPLEPAQFGVPIVTGPHMENFRGIAAVLLAQSAMRVSQPEQLPVVLGELLASPAAAEMGRRAQQVFQANAGASQRCFEAISALLAQNPTCDRQLESR